LKEVVMSKDDAYGDSAVKMSRWLPFLDEAMGGLQAKMDRQKGDGGQEEAQVAPGAAIPPPAPPEMGGPGWDDEDFDAWADGLDEISPAAPVAEPPPAAEEDARLGGGGEAAPAPPDEEDAWLGGGDEAAPAPPDEEGDWLGAMDGDDWPGGGEEAAPTPPDEGGAGGGEDWLAEIGG
jgi:hypothetical protein